MTNILFIDDERNPPLFPDGTELSVCRTSQEALKALQAHKKFDEIWLDFDLGDGDTCEPVVNHLAEAGYNNQHPSDLIMIHTANPVARNTIRQMCERYGYRYETVRLNTGTINS